MKVRRTRFEEELRLLSWCHHQNIVTIHGMIKTPTNDVWMAMELLDIALDKFIARHASSPNEWADPDRKRIALGIALGVEYLHKGGILHRDLKSPNVMLTGESKRSAKLIDFGLSKDTNNAKVKSTTIRGSSSLWMAPEIGTNDDFNQATDVYALGMLMTELVFLKYPSPQALVNVSKMNDKNMWKPLIVSCTHEDPSQRLTASKVVQIIQLSRRERAKKRNKSV